MGQSLSTYRSGGSSSPSLKAKVCVVGPPLSGKTSILTRLRANPDACPISSTLTATPIGINTESVTRDGLTMLLWDADPSALDNTPSFDAFFSDCLGVILVVDSLSPEQVAAAGSLLAQTRLTRALSDLPLLVFANKQDRSHAARPSDIAAEIGLVSRLTAKRDVVDGGVCATPKCLAAGLLPPPATAPIGQRAPASALGPIDSTQSAPIPLAATPSGNAARHTAALETPTLPAQPKAHTVPGSVGASSAIDSVYSAATPPLSPHGRSSTSSGADASAVAVASEGADGDVPVVANAPGAAPSASRARDAAALESPAATASPAAEEGGEAVSVPLGGGGDSPDVGPVGHADVAGRDRNAAPDTEGGPKKAAAESADEVAWVAALGASFNDSFGGTGGTWVAEWHVQGTSAATGEGIEEGIAWLAGALKRHMGVA